MNWWRENPWLGGFGASAGGATLASLVFVWLARSSFDEAKAQLEEEAVQLAVLEGHQPFPTEANLRTMKTQAEAQAAALVALKQDLKTRVLPLPAEMKPNEFQARLRQAMTGVADKARSQKVKLPENFFLGFEEFAAVLPATEAAPVLGQELAQVELLLNLLIDARVAGISSLRRMPRSERAAPGALVERNVIDLAFSASPGALRRVLNQIASAEQQLYVVRRLQVLNEKDKGPPRGVVGAATPRHPGLNFIVGNEHVQARARIEMVRFTF